MDFNSFYFFSTVLCSPSSKDLCDTNVLHIVVIEWTRPPAVLQLYSTHNQLFKQRASGKKTPLWILKIIIEIGKPEKL